MEEEGGTSSGGSTHHGLERKRQRDREYRQRRKEEEIEKKNALEAVGQQNQQLKEENQYLRACNSLMNQSLQCSTEEYEQLKAEFDRLKRQQSKKFVLVQTLSDDIAASDQVREENRKLREENLELRGRMADGELVQVADEIARLTLENTTLQVQKDALCLKSLDVQEERDEE